MKKLKYLSTLLVAALAIIAAWLVWNYYTQSPWTRDGKVRAEQVGVTPQVSGSILQLNVRDNQLVKAGDVLFRIDDTPYKIALLNARAQLAKAKAEVARAQAEQKKAASDASRRRHLSQNFISAEDLENANTALNTATTNLEAAKAVVGVGHPRSRPMAAHADGNKSAGRRLGHQSLNPGWRLRRRWPPGFRPRG